MLQWEHDRTSRSTVAQFSDNPGWARWEAVKRIFRYLRGTQKLELVYGGEKRGLEGYVTYVNADGASQEHRHAISGFLASKMQEVTL